MLTPPGLSQADFSAALAAFARVVGTEWVFSRDDDVALYRDAYSPFAGEPDELLAAAAVAPQSVEQVQEVVRIANRSVFLCTPFQPAGISATAERHRR